MTCWRCLGDDGDSGNGDDSGEGGGCEDDEWVMAGHGVLIHQILKCDTGAKMDR